MIEVYIGIGSNLDEPLQHVKQAISELRQLAHSEYIATSALYRSSPMGPADQPDYINAVSLLQTDLVPLELPLLECMEGEDGSLEWQPKKVFFQSG